MDTLGITTPLTTGLHVTAAQKTLNGGNLYGRDFLNGSVDGQFGEETGRACVRAKYWLGYPTKELTPTYGDYLNNFLKGLQRPTVLMRRRRSIRQKQAAQTPLRAKALNVARGQIGYKETPAGSNHTKYGVWYGLDRNPWCAMFVSWCYAAVGSKAFVKGSRYAYVPYIVNDAGAGRNGLSLTSEPQPGDLVCYDWDGGGIADHMGLFEAWTTEGHIFHAVEGNTSLGNDSNGGEVMRRTRNVGQVQAFVRVGR